MRGWHGRAGAPRPRQMLFVTRRNMAFVLIMADKRVKLTMAVDPRHRLLWEIYVERSSTCGFWMADVRPLKKVRTLPVLRQHSVRLPLVTVSDT